MNALVILFMITSVLNAFWQYSKKRNIAKLLLILASFAFVVTLAVVGNLTRGIAPIFYLHWIFEIVAWFGVIDYMLRGKYRWWIIASPLLTIGAFVLLEYLNGSRHETIGVI